MLEALFDTWKHNAPRAAHPRAGDQVIEGIRRALIGMRVGGTRRVIVPPSLGFVKEELKPKPVDWGRQTQIQRSLARFTKLIQIRSHDVFCFCI